MGVYINPPTMSKEEFLAANGSEIPHPKSWNEIPGDKALVVLIDNFVFTAAGVAYNSREFEAFAGPHSRPRRFFLVPRASLHGVIGGYDEEILGKEWGTF